MNEKYTGRETKKKFHTEGKNAQEETQTNLTYSYPSPFPEYYGLIFLHCNSYHLLLMFELIIGSKCIKKHFVVKRFSLSRYKSILSVLFIILINFYRGSAQKQTLHLGNRIGDRKHHKRVF